RAALAVGGLHEPGDLLAVAAERLPVGGESREQLLVRQDGGRDLGPDTRLGVRDEGVGDEELARRALPGAAVPVEERDGDRDAEDRAPLAARLLDTADEGELGDETPTRRAPAMAGRLGLGPGGLELGPVGDGALEHRLQRWRRERRERDRLEAAHAVDGERERVGQL